MSVQIVTVSREYGSGGREFGLTLANRLGWDSVDSRIVDEVARRMQCPEDVVERWDERAEGMILRLLRTLQSAHPEMVAPGPVAPPFVSGDPSPERLLATVREVIREEARSGKSVIVGRGATWILQTQPDCLHIRLVAAKEDRVRRIASRFALSQEDALKKLEQIDRERSTYLKQNFGIDWRDPLHFALVVNTSLVPVPKAVEIVASLVEEAAP